jgi:ergothioneine biosynthesis protein EgtB
MMNFLQNKLRPFIVIDIAVSQDLCERFLIYLLTTCPSIMLISQESFTDVISRFQDVRQQTEKLCAPLETEDYVVQTADVVSPVKWHIGHASWLFENFILKVHKKGYQAFDSRYDYIFNSYYTSVSAFYDKNSRGSLSRPTVEQVYAFRKHVDFHMMELLTTAQPEVLQTLVPLVELGLQHEQQHQELMVYDFKHIFYHNPLKPVYIQRKESHGERGITDAQLNWVGFDESLEQYGFAGEGFAYDNEMPVHKHYLPAFKLADRPVLNGEWLEFMESGGYLTPRYWLDNGWKTRKTEGWEAPMYWTREGNQWYVFTLSGLMPLNEWEPVCHVSFYEADAYARWKGLRLPTEWEWEKASKEQPIEGNFVDSRYFHPKPYQEENKDFSKLFGDVWEWTQSAYLPYPGFRFINDGLGEYNGKFMNNQMVLKGGSCATPANHIRRTYRNFFEPSSRWQFSGLRLAE